ncbi:MAG: DUF1922 domain-containing protein [Candidatus Lokiarchaeota archaeon]|nr:DUF1922 domain-containing protein [Candidatus Lokiarchaeota archaeon]
MYQIFNYNYKVKNKLNRIKIPEGYTIKAEYFVFKCPKCGLPQYSRRGRKTRKCPKCGKRINLKKVWIRGYASEVYEAVALIQQWKVVNIKREKIESVYQKKLN